MRDSSEEEEEEQQRNITQDERKIQKEKKIKYTINGTLFLIRKK